MKFKERDNWPDYYPDALFGGCCAWVLTVGLRDFAKRQAVEPPACWRRAKGYTV